MIMGESDSETAIKEGALDTEPEWKVTTQPNATGAIGSHKAQNPLPPQREPWTRVAGTIPTLVVRVRNENHSGSQGEPWPASMPIACSLLCCRAP